VMTGGAIRSATPLPEEHFHALEREVFIELCQTAKTHERIRHMLETGKPLRN
jgi:3-hydroxyacyl-CoA dehydrogenase